MMQRVLPFEVADVATSPEQVAAALNKACNSRLQHHHVTGVCQLADRVYFVLNPVPATAPGETYLLAPLRDVSPGGFPAEIFERWSSGFNTIGTIDLEGSFMAVYGIPESPK